MRDFLPKLQSSFFIPPSPFKGKKILNEETIAKKMAEASRAPVFPNPFTSPSTSLNSLTLFYYKSFILVHSIKSVTYEIQQNLSEKLL